jgi:16S rRNA (adenine1518-N6/adenine1519-N6)-dimethyltransferase
MTREAFERLVVEAILLIPKRFRREMKNLALVVEDEPSPELLEEMEIDAPDSLYGLYQGTPLPERSWAFGNALPDRITLFQRVIEEDCDDEDEVRAVIGETLIHEVGHYFGLSEETGAARRWGPRKTTDGRRPPMQQSRVAESGGRHRERAGGARVRNRTLRAKKRFGQHFLEPAWVDKLVAVLEPTQDDTFLEIGPGRGALTRPLAPRVRRIVAVEIDRDLAAALRAQLPPNVRLVLGDFLHADLDDLLGAEPLPLRVVGNLPYNVAAPILFRLLHAADEGRRFRDATLMLQKEVADRLAARPGERRHGALAIQVALLADVDRLLTLPAGAFRPPPKVTSAVVRLRFHALPAGVRDVAAFERVVRGIFLQRRKTLLNALRPVAASFGRSASEIIDSAGVDPTKRPEALSVDDMVRLTRAVL